MTAKTGAFIAIEGTDGSGKGTQAKLLAEKLRANGYDVAEFDFPQYEHPSSYFVKQYLNGKYGTSDEVGPYTSSLFFALDRYEAAPAIRQALAEGKVVITNRYTGSNMGHQGTKFFHAEERRGYFIWLDNLEYQMLGIPRPDRSFILRVPADIAQRLVDQKVQRIYTKEKRDILEADLSHLEKSVEVYDDLAQLFPKDYTRIDCVRGGKLMDIDMVHELLYKTVEPLLPPLSQKSKAESRKPEEPNPYVDKAETGYRVTSSGEAYLNELITSTNGDVYVFNNKLSQNTIAAAMARLSRRGDDLRVTLLDEFAMAEGKDSQLLERVITEYGDDSVQQLAGIHVVVENASNILTKKLEWGRLAAYLEQSTRYISFDQKDEEGNYKYYTPDNLDPDTAQDYRSTMNEIFELYFDLTDELTRYIADKSKVPKEKRDTSWKNAVHAQACDAARAVLPAATRSTVGIYASAQALENMIMRLLSDALPEARSVGQQILDHARQVMPMFLARTDQPERGGATIAYRSNTRKSVRSLAKKFLPDNHASPGDSVQLISYWPKNEMDLLPDMLYEHSSLSLKEIEKEVSKWPIERKEKLFNAYMGERLNRRHKPGRAIEKAHYSWDLLCDYGIFRDLQRHRMVEDLEWQMLTPRFGYEIPKLVDEAGLSETFEKCFDLSLELYSMLQEKGYELEAQYATLLGHKMRWKVTYNAREAFHLHELRTSPQGHPGYRKLMQQMHEKLAEIHPMIAEAMKFVDKDEDPELTRLAAERYAQFKLEKL